MNPTTFKAVIEKDHAKLAGKLEAAVQMKKTEQKRKQRQVAKSQTVGQQARSTLVSYGGSSGI